jgi:hypothetical protein
MQERQSQSDEAAKQETSYSSQASDLEAMQEAAAQARKRQGRTLYQ